MKPVYSPQILRLPADRTVFDVLVKDEKAIVHDEIYGQLQELIKGKHPSVKIKPEEYSPLIDLHLAGQDIFEYGVWAWYPWSRRLVHLLDEEEFAEVRTNRNQYKITRAERDALATKRIGIVGLSVGQSIALTLSMERGFGELRLADFDTLELSNLNRIRTGVHNLGVPKVAIAAREIAEIDPFLRVTCFFDGLTEANIDAFFTDGGKLDLFVDECDGLDMKIISRFKARELGIPVLMDTSDRGMLDIERFDLEPKRPILHGAVENVDASTIKGLSNEDKVPIILQMLGADNISLRAKASMIEVEQTINTWPQLASSVTLGGAVGADLSRRILLDQFHDSGRYYIDLDELITDRHPIHSEMPKPENPFKPLSTGEMWSAVAKDQPSAGISPDAEVIRELVQAAAAAPSTGNDQPWKWLYQKGTLYLYHDKFRSFSFGDFGHIASYLTFGAAYENLYLHGLSRGLEASYTFQPNGPENGPVAAIRFQAVSGKVDPSLRDLEKAIAARHTNRNLAPKTAIDTTILDQLKAVTESIPGASLTWFTRDEDLAELADIIGACDRARLLNPAGHHDFVHHEMRWTSEDAARTKDGIDIKTLGLSNSQLAALNILKNGEVIKTINELQGGKALDMLAKRTVKAASAIAMIILPEYALRNFFEGGRALERFWLAATLQHIAVHPLISPFYLFPRVVYGNGEGLDAHTTAELNGLRKRFKALTGITDGKAEAFLTKIAIAPEPELKAFRLPVEEILTFAD
jgi:molybdopterin/thiamine biosynthesis adenylyltransferase